MLFRFRLLAFSLFLSISPAHASFLPPQFDVDPSALQSGPAQVSEAQFRQVIDQIRTAYAPVVAHHGGQLMISGDWSNQQIFAGANQVFSFWQVTVTGGLARRPELTPDGLTLVVCHEVGHHLGGFPFRPAELPVMGTWSANEGEADYFATQVCARRLWGPERTVNAGFRARAGAAAHEHCDHAWSETDQQNLCYRTFEAIGSMIQTMATLLKQPVPKVETPDAAEVASTNHDHPAVQCRMDTAVQGAICVAPFSDDVIPGKRTSAGPASIDAEREAGRFSCMKADGFSNGLRPRCWFKPQL